MKKLLFIFLALPMAVFAAESAVHLDRAPINPRDHGSLQRGARVFVNYCLTCHSAGYMRYNRMQDIGLSEAQIKDNLLFASEKPGELMKVAMTTADAKAWFGVPPPDLSVITRARSSDWVYTYLRGFYRDDTRPTGWNNTLFDKVGMPHALYELQGQMAPVYHTVQGEDGKSERVIDHFELVKPGKLTLAEYDALAGDLVNYLAWVSEPAKSHRMTTGVFVMLFLGLFFIIAFYLKKDYWKDLH